MPESNVSQKLVPHSQIYKQSKDVEREKHWMDG